MRMAHLYPLSLPSHHEIHLREEEAEALTKELQELGFDFGIHRPVMETRFPLVAKIHRLLGARNTHEDRMSGGIAHSYPSRRSLA